MSSTLLARVLAVVIAFATGGLSVAWAAVPISLPPDANSPAWTAALALGDFVVVPPSDAPCANACVRIRRDPGIGAFVLFVRSAEGEESTEAVANTTTPEALITLANQHLRTYGNDVDETAPVYIGKPPPVEEVRPRAGARPWAAVGTGVGWRPESKLGLDLRAAGGVALGDHLVAGLGADLRPAEEIAGVEGSGLGAWELYGVAWWAFSSRPAPMIGVLAGAALHSFSHDGTTIRRVPSPIVGVNLSVAVPLTGSLTGSLAVVPYVEARAGLRAGTIQDGADGTPTAFSRWEARAGATFRIGGRR